MLRAAAACGQRPAVVPSHSSRRGGDQWSVYAITHLPTGRVYIGKARKPNARWANHVYLARHGSRTKLAGSLAVGA